jgi:hypothetical protein
VLLHYKTYIPNHERYLGTEENKGKQREKGLVGDSKKNTHAPTQTQQATVAEQECDCKEEHKTATAEVRFSC